MTPEQLLHYEPRLRELAARLVSDHHRADDLVQETYLSALRQNLLFGAAPARWLRDVLRTKARQLELAERRRMLREQTVAASKGESSTEAEAAERLTLLNALVRELFELREPYRSTLQLRFLEELPPREIARQHQVPVRTVYTRIARGLRMMRDRLDARHGNGAWVPLWLAVLRPPASAPAPPLRPRVWPASAHKLLRAAVVLLAISTVSLIWLRSRVSADPELAPLASASHGDEPPELERPLTAPDREQPARRPATLPTAPALPSTPESASYTHTGRVIDLQGAAVAGVRVTFKEGRDLRVEDSTKDLSKQQSKTLVEARSREDGSFELDIPADTAGFVLIRGRHFGGVVSQLVKDSGQAQRELLLLAAPRREIHGVVADGEGRPLSDVYVRMRPSEEFLGSLARDETGWIPLKPSATSDSSGRFRLSNAYEMDGLRLDFQKAGFARKVLKLEASASPLEVVLEAAQPVVRVRGTVRKASGEPAAGTLVTLGRERVHTDLRGDFELEPQILEAEETLWAIAAGVLPARFELRRAADGSYPVPAELELFLGGETLSIEGKVLDHEGYAVPGALVWLVDATPVGRDLSSWFAELHLKPTGNMRTPIAVHTDAKGEFQLPYLLERDYRIGALWTLSGVNTLSEPVPAGSHDLVLRLPTDDPQLPVAGRALAADGSPLVGVEVAVILNTMDVSFPGGARFMPNIKGNAIRTDAQGNFSIQAVPESGWLLAVRGGGVFSKSYSLPEGEEREALEIVVPRRARLRVDSTEGQSKAERFALIDRSGTSAPLYAAREFDDDFEQRPLLRAPLEHGRSDLLVVPDTAAIIVFYDESGEELERLPIALSTRGVNVLHY